MNPIKIQLNPALSPQHKQALSTYLLMPNRLNRAEWTIVYEAVDLLGASQVVLKGQSYTFAQFYNAFIDVAYADDFIAALWEAEDVEAAGRQQQQTIVQAIRGQFQTSGWAEPTVTGGRFLLTYCLYWWTSFTVGYTFEVAVLRDLARSDVEFESHDPRRRTERYAPADLMVGEFVGDMKSSTYFLFVSRSYPLRHDFYITRLWEASARRYQWMVILTPAMWEQINGETVATEFARLLDVMPQPGQFDLAGIKLMALGYTEWKEKMSHYQQTGDNYHGTQTD